MPVFRGPSVSLSVSLRVYPCFHGVGLVVLRCPVPNLLFVSTNVPGSWSPPPVPARGHGTAVLPSGGGIIARGGQQGYSMCGTIDVKTVAIDRNQRCDVKSLLIFIIQSQTKRLFSSMFLKGLLVSRDKDESGKKLSTSCRPGSSSSRGTLAALAGVSKVKLFPPTILYPFRPWREGLRQVHTMAGLDFPRGLRVSPRDKRLQRRRCILIGY
jgi:hypothetical protein